MARKYTKKFKEPLFKEACKVCVGCGKLCECFEKDLAKSCKKMKEAIRKLEEACPEGTKPKSGGCANADGNSYRKGVCDTGYQWDPAAGSTGKCIHKTDDSKHQARSER